VVRKHDPPPPLRRYRTALELIVRHDINRTLAAAGRPVTPIDRLHTVGLEDDWRLINRYRQLGVPIQ